VDDHLAEIRANLDDDAPRLAYAEVLQRRGDPLGEFIAVQCELAQLGHVQRPTAFEWVGDALLDDEPADPDRARTLRSRENTLLREHEATWAAGAKSVSVHRRYVFERGFVSRIMADGRKSLERVLDVVPTLVELELSNLNGSARIRLDARALVQLRALAIHASALRDVCSTRPRALQRLEVADTRTWQPDPLIKWGAVAQLRALDLVMANVGADRVIDLLDAARLLEELQLRQAKLGEAGALALAGCRNTRSLRALSLVTNRIGCDGAAALASSEHLRQLRALDVRTCTIRRDGARAIGDAFAELRTLDLTSNPLGTEGLRALVGGSGLTALRELCLQATRLDDAAVRILADAPLLAHVQVLSLRANDVTDVGARALAASPFAKHLRAINLDKTRVTAVGKQALTRAIDGVRVG